MSFNLILHVTLKFLVNYSVLHFGFLFLLKLHMEDSKSVMYALGGKSGIWIVQNGVYNFGYQNRNVLDMGLDFRMETV